MSKSDFLKELYIASVSAGLIKPSSEGAEVQHVMQVLFQRYLEVARTIGDLTRSPSDRSLDAGQRGSPRTVPLS